MQTTRPRAPGPRRGVAIRPVANLTPVPAPASTRVRVASPDGTIAYEDSRDHFENGVLRLLGLTGDDFARWLAAAERSGAGDLLASLAAGFREIRPDPPAPAVDGRPVDAGPSGEPGRIWHAAIAENPGVGFALDAQGTLAWLVRPEGDGFRREVAPPVYEESYFEDAAAGTGGYGSYGEQAPWRMEKARRQVGEIAAETGLTGGRALDVGCGYGYFRAALAEAGFAHEGVEISDHARAAATALFGFDTSPGVLEDHLGDWRGAFDLLTMWDVIEHVPDAVELLAAAAGCLRPGGVMAIKTPSVDCPEAEVFGPHYHSLKREHLILLGPRSIAAAAGAAGLDVVAVRTLSHLLSGFVGDEGVRAWADAGRGADVVAYLRAR